MTFEYKVVPAPTRGRKARGVKTPADRFARALEDAINDLAADGWEYLRTDTLPAEQRQGLTGRTTVYQNMLVFRRAVETEAKVEDIVATAPAPAVDARAPRPVAPADMPTAEPSSVPSPETSTGNSLDTLIAEELAAARAPRLPSAGAAQEAPATPVKAPAVGGAKNEVAAE